MRRSLPTTMAGSSCATSKVLKDFAELGARHGLKPWEIPGKVLLEFEPFSEPLGRKLGQNLLRRKRKTHQESSEFQKLCMYMCAYVIEYAYIHICTYIVSITYFQFFLNQQMYGFSLHQSGPAW